VYTQISNISDVEKPPVRILIPGDDIAFNSFLYAFANFSPKER